MESRNLKSVAVFAIAALGTLGALSIGYGAYVSNYPATAASGSTLSSSEWNKMVSALQTLDTNLSAFTVSGGKVGIGTAPVANLHVQASQPSVNLESTNTGDWSRSSILFGHLQDGVTTPIAQIYSRLTCWWTCAAWDLRFSTTLSNVQNDRMTILASGEVGIWTTAPSQKLDVVGNVKASWWFVFPDGNTQTKAFQWVMTVRTSVQTFTLANGGSTTYVASCLAGEVATWGGCQDSGYKDFYYWQPTSSSYTCGWYNTSGYTRTYTNATVFVNCLK